MYKPFPNGWFMAWFYPHYMVSQALGEIHGISWPILKYGPPTFMQLHSYIIRTAYCLLHLITYITDCIILVEFGWWFQTCFLHWWLTSVPAMISPYNPQCAWNSTQKFLQSSSNFHRGWPEIFNRRLRRSVSSMMRVWCCCVAQRPDWGLPIGPLAKWVKAQKFCTPEPPFDDHDSINLRWPRGLVLILPFMPRIFRGIIMDYQDPWPENPH